jgi:hypothetical protein
MSKFFKLDNKNYRYEFKIWLSATCAFLILATFAFGSQAFNIMLSGDGWSEFVSPYPTQYEWTIRIGRYLSPLIWKIFGDNEFANSWLYLYFFLSVWIFFFLIISRTEYISPSSVFVSSSIFLFTPSLVEMSAFQVDIPVRSTGFILLGIALYFYWIKDSSIPEKSCAEILNPKRTSISVICLTACAACYQPIALMFVPGFLLISLFNGRLYLTNIRKGTIICIVSFMSYFLLWRFLLLFYDFGLGSNEGYDILVTENITMLSKFVEIFNNFIDFIILPKNSMPAFVSVFLTLLSAQLVYIFAPPKKFLQKSVFTFVFVFLLIGLIPTLIFIYKGTYSALRPQALMSMYFTPALLIGVGVGKANTFGFKIGSYFWVIAFLLIGIQSFQTSSVITQKQAAYEKDIITGQAILSDLMDVAPNRAFITVNIFIEESKITYSPERTYYSVPRNRWQGISNSHVFDSQPGRIHQLLKIVAPAQVKLTTHNVKDGDSVLLKTPLKKLPSWPNQNSIKVLPDDSLLLKIGAPAQRPVPRQDKETES